MYNLTTEQMHEVNEPVEAMLFSNSYSQKHFFFLVGRETTIIWLHLM